MSFEHERLKEDMNCLTNRNSDLKKDFAETKGVNTNLAEAFATKDSIHGG